MSPDYVCVAKLAGFYIPIHTSKGKSSFHAPESDIKVAQATAKAFAEAKKIPYRNNLLQIDRPVITVMNHNRKWYPAELLPEMIRRIESFGKGDIGGTQDQAIQIAKNIATDSKFPFFPQFGISLEKKSP